MEATLERLLNHARTVNVPAHEGDRRLAEIMRSNGATFFEIADRLNCEPRRIVTLLSHGKGTGEEGSVESQGGNSEGRQAQAVSVAV